MELKVGKKYLTGAGDVVEITHKVDSMDFGHLFLSVGGDVPVGYALTYMVDGSVYCGTTKENYLVEELE